MHEMELFFYYRIFHFLGISTIGSYHENSIAIDGEAGDSLT